MLYFYFVCVLTIVSITVVCSLPIEASYLFFIKSLDEQWPSVDSYFILLLLLIKIYLLLIGSIVDLTKSSGFDVDMCS